MKLNWKNDEELKKLAEKIEARSPYKKIENPNKKWMTVAQMGKMLGLKKTDRYWLIHKNYFRTETLMGKMRVDVESFEKWYANQVKYHKIGGEAPGKELKEHSLSARDIEEILDCGSWTAYEIMNKFKDDIIIVDYWKRLPAEVFWKWYEGQTRYRTNGCKQCYSVCPQKCINISVKPVEIDQKHCLHCGRCAEACPKQVIKKVG